ncbi:MAG: DUF2461 domain-containing protein [Gemmatimonadaceae bacterium]|jgi:uncharacterized protein (TIGR02453 family)|nr:DUF2461 domain-containing protein [Gemmatimonadaceae bacterium]
MANARLADPDRFEGFGPGSLRFLRGLARQNNKEWFEAHRPEYEQEIKRPLLALIEEVDVRLASLAPELVGTKKSMFRIHRDVRFSKDKRPYKTHAACWFYHRDAGRAVGENAAHGGAGFYFHFAPGEVFTGGGVWMPPRPALLRIRDAIAEQPEQFTAIVTAPSFRKRFGALEQEHMLTRLPRGYAADHPAGDWLRYQSFTAGRALEESVIGSRRLIDTLLKDFEVLLPLVRWINRVSGLLPATSR